MKKFILSIMALCSAAIVSAQQTETISATLQTGDNTQVFYSITALVDALNAADNGSIITLSSGTFNVPSNIEKQVKISSIYNFLHYRILNQADRVESQKADQPFLPESFLKEAVQLFL